MSVKIFVPVGEIMAIKTRPLILELNGRCSRCGQPSAPYYEVHQLQLQSGAKKNRMYGKKYAFTKDYKLKIGICENCYRSDFLTRPEIVDRNGSKLGRIATLHSILWTLGGTLAAIGLLLLTPFVPETSRLQPFKILWPIPIGAGLLFIAVTWFMQKKQQKQILNDLEINVPDYQSHIRAETHTTHLDNVKDLSSTALEITMNNEKWASEIAVTRGWAFEKVNAPTSVIPSSEK